MVQIVTQPQQQVVFLIRGKMLDQMGWYSIVSDEKNFLINFSNRLKNSLRAALSTLLVENGYYELDALRLRVALPLPTNLEEVWEFMNNCTDYAIPVSDAPHSMRYVN